MFGTACGENVFPLNSLENAAKKGRKKSVFFSFLSLFLVHDRVQNPGRKGEIKIPFFL